MAKIKMKETVRMAGYSWEKGDVINSEDIPQNIRAEVMAHGSPVASKNVERAVPKKAAEER